MGEHQRLTRGEALEATTTEALANLDSFWLVGIVEQYAGFEDVLKRLLDPSGKQTELWKTYATSRSNK